jgi:hypothetical protein
MRKQQGSNARFMLLGVNCEQPCVEPWKNLNQSRSGYRFDGHNTKDSEQLEWKTDRRQICLLMPICFDEFRLFPWARRDLKSGTKDGASLLDHF